jgi:nucleoside-diphosphate-sugar epimerase
MQDQIHTVLGSNGAIGKAVLRELRNRNLNHRSVSRSADSVQQPNFIQADLLNPKETALAIAGSAYVYLCIGLPYSSKIWSTQWEQLMKNVIDACAEHSAKLIFLDNVYMYGSPLPVPFDENAIQAPPSKKGKARKRTADLLLKAMQEGRVKGLIGRSADFYGEGAVNSSFYTSFLDRMLKGKAPQTLSSGDIVHTYANVRDNGRALVELALCDDCYGQVWHLPVGEPITTRQMLGLFNQELGSNHQLSVMPSFMRKILSLFIPILKEVGEMLYQFEGEYVMSFEKFKQRFPDFEVTPYQQGVQRMVKWFKNRGGESGNF